MIINKCRYPLVFISVFLLLALVLGCGSGTMPPADTSDPPLASDPDDIDELNGNDQDPQERKSQELLVPSQFGTIQAAIDTAEAGDTVIVAPGTYVENINFKGKDITVRSTNPELASVVETTIIDGNGEGVVVIFESGETADAVLAGFTITNGNGQDGGGIRIETNYEISYDETSPTITNNIIKDNNAEHGGGLYARFSRSLITDNLFKNNTTSNSGGGLMIGQDTVLKVTGNTFDSNSADYFGGAMAVSATAEITNNIFIDNTAGLDCGSIIIFGGYPEFEDNTFSGNYPPNHDLDLDQ